MCAEHSPVLVFVLPAHTAKVEQVKFDTTQLHARPELAAEQRMVDDASGEIEVRELLWLTQGAIISLFPSITWFLQLGGDGGRTSWQFTASSRGTGTDLFPLVTSDGTCGIT